MRTRLNQLLSDTKNEIVRLLVDIYKHNNNGLLPNWEDDEEIEISDNVIDNLTIYIDVDYHDVNCVLKELLPPATSVLLNTGKVIINLSFS